MCIRDRYTAEDHCAALPVADYIARFRDAKRFLECCRACRNYGCSWGCPPFGYDVGAYLSQYTSALIIATKITPAEQHVPMSEAGRLIRPERQRLERRLLEMERRYGGRSFAYVGTCLYCPEGTLSLIHICAGEEMKRESGANPGQSRCCETP